MSPGLNQLVKDDREQSSKNTKYKFFAASLFVGVTTVSLLAGFSRTFMSVRRQDVKQIQSKTVIEQEDTTQAGIWLALKALGIATVLSCGGCSLIAYGLSKLSGASNFEEFRLKMGSILPKVSSDKTSVGRTEFDSFRDLFEYLSSLKSEKDLDNEDK